MSHETAASFNPNQNTIFLVTHGRHVVLYLKDWKGTKEPIKRFFDRLIAQLDDEEISILQLYARQGWRDGFHRCYQAVINLLVASQLQEAIGHLHREDDNEDSQELMVHQRELLNEVLDEVLKYYSEFVDTKMVDNWKKANALGQPGPEYAPPPGYLDHIARLPPPAAATPDP